MESIRRKLLDITLGSRKIVYIDQVRIVREQPDFGTVDLKTRQFSEITGLRFHRAKQAAFVIRCSDNMLFGGGIQVISIYLTVSKEG